MHDDKVSPRTEVNVSELYRDGARLDNALRVNNVLLPDDGFDRRKAGSSCLRAVPDSGISARQPTSTFQQPVVQGLRHTR